LISPRPKPQQANANKPKLPEKPCVPVSVIVDVRVDPSGTIREGGLKATLRLGDFGDKTSTSKKPRLVSVPLVPTRSLSQTPTGVFPVVDIVKISPIVLLGAKTTEDVPRDTVNPPKPEDPMHASAVRDTVPEKAKRLLTLTTALPVDPRITERWPGKIDTPKP
jgi:hypothetical protein